MTLEQMNKYARLRRELEQAENLKASLLEATDLKAQVLTGMPHMTGYKDKLGIVIPKILDELPLIEAHIDGLRTELLKSEAEIDSFISTIQDVQTRTIFKLRFLGGFTWTWIAVAVGGGNTEDSVKKRCYRYLGARM